MLNNPIKQCLIISILLAVAVVSEGQVVSPQIIKSAYLVRFFSYITWVNEQNIDSFRIGVVGSDEKLFRELSEAVKTNRAKGKRVTVKKTGSLKEMPDFHMIFIVFSLGFHYQCSCIFHYFLKNT